MIGIEKTLRTALFAMIAVGLCGSAEAGRIRHQASAVHPASKAPSAIDNLWTQAVRSVESNYTTSTTQSQTSLASLYRALFPQHKAAHPTLQIKSIRWHRYRATPPAEAQVVAAAMPSPSLAAPPAATASASARRPLVAEAQVLAPIAPAPVPEPSGLLVGLFLLAGAAAWRRSSPTGRETPGFSGRDRPRIR